MSDVVLRTDKDWSVIDGEMCRVKTFTPLATVIDGRVSSPSRGTPYASVVLEGEARQIMTGFITHQVDFAHLWAAFKGRGVQANEEVIVVWTRERLKRSAKLVSKVMPKLIVMICPENSFDLMIDQDFRPELTGLARYQAAASLEEWRPDVMD